VEKQRDRAFTGRERHDDFRKENNRPVGYPMRAVRTDDFLYIRNFCPERVPSADTPDRHTDNDPGPTKTFLAGHRDDPKFRRFHQLAYGSRPREELYDLRTDPGQLVNVAARPEYAAAKKRLAADLDRWMKAMGDPRATGNGDVFDTYPYYGGGPGPKKPVPQQQP
jgi:hypothetical protein